jgi:hypothetical protein
MPVGPTGDGVAVFGSSPGERTDERRSTGVPRMSEWGFHIIAFGNTQS